MRREYVRVRPTSERISTEHVQRLLESLHTLQTTNSGGTIERLNPFWTPAPTQFEFLTLSEGADEPVEFYYGVDGHLDTLEKRLRSIYPSTFEISRVEFDVASRLIQPVEFTRPDFIEQYTAGNLRYEFGASERTTVDTTDSQPDQSDAADSIENAGSNSAFDHSVQAGETVLKLAPPSDASSGASEIPLTKPTETFDGTILARPSLDAVSPVGVHWSASATRSRDWMTSLPHITSESSGDESTVDERNGRALASLIDHVTQATSPIAFQVVFQPRTVWQSEADLRVAELLDGRDTVFQQFVGTLLDGGLERESSSKERLSESVAKRIDAIEQKNSTRSFSVNIRAVGVPTAESARDHLANRMDALCHVFDSVSGPFYQVSGERLRAGRFREKTREKAARTALSRVLERQVVTGRGKTRPDFVLDGAELAQFLLVPSAKELSADGIRGTRAEQQSRRPLPLPNPDLLQQFQTGMAIGYALDENRTCHRDPVRIPPRLLTMHYARFASTGSGKSTSNTNDTLSLRATTSGPVITFDPKGDGMCVNYLRAHFKLFGSVDDVYYFRVPEILPAVSFFDIRPAIARGRPREDAIQDKVDHFHDILRMVMGRDTYEQAFVANEIIGYLIKALFDKEYGSDAFGLNDLFEAALQMQRDSIIPPISAANQNVEESLTRHLAKDDHQFETSMNAVGNRLDKLMEDTHLRQLFNHVPEQRDAGSDGEYLGNRFDFADFLSRDVTILFDIGDLRPEAQRAITLLLLSNLWDAVQIRRRDGITDYDKTTNLIIEEAAPIASTKLVSKQLLPQGRSFGLSMGLMMQFPGQVRERSERAYNELLNNIKTKIIGNISIDRDLIESLAHEDLSPTDLRNRINTLPNGEWIVQLPSPLFGETGPAPFSLKSLPIAPGHPESDDPLSVEQEAQFEADVLPQLTERTQVQYGLAEDTGESESVGGEGWGSRPNDERSTATDPTQSSFIGEATSDSTVDEDEDEEDTDTNSPYRDSGATDTDEPVGEEGSPVDERGPSPVRDGGVPVADEELRRRGLTHDDIRFLIRVLDVMNGDAPDHRLIDSMSSFENDFDDLDVQRLVEQDLVEECQACGRKYYTVLPAGRDLLGQRLKVGPGQGDIGEKTPHKVGVKLLEQWINSLDSVEQVEPYYEYNEETVFDVAGLDADGELVWVGEVELPSNNSHASIDDFDKLAAVDADAIWAFNNRETALEVLDRLAEGDRIDESVSGRDARSFSAIRDAVEDFDAAGMTTVRGFKNLDHEVNQ
ncbi:ATP-binding protein [Salinigranum halophilum]|uniref:ATP-binding protein n=1 Tax=Salinigranum halophilum TaxID=2565931 RepID=UPI00115DFFBE|nr:ATP-binding protein [Salinigranum halophilum]